MIAHIRDLVFHKHFWVYACIVYAVGIAGLSFSATQPLFIRLIPLNILLANLILFVSMENTDRRFWLLAGSIALLGFLAEVAGIHTGLIFGDYQYGSALGPKVFGVPLLIGLNWTFMVFSSVSIARQVGIPAGFLPFMGAVVMLNYDFWLEPAAMRFDMWQWFAGIVPPQNYLAWFLFGFAFCALYTLTGPVYENRSAARIFGIQLLFFIILRVTA
ncbi:MAG: carotenoid biosynthesis protein [Bacteroidia bacterium]|nr:carotenoid biosynthesis protein [Bacteroidia bacterium]